jgi:hypothetical protein
MWKIFNNPSREFDMCQCFQIGGPFIGADPECSEHGYAAQRAAAHREVIIQQCQRAVTFGTEEEQTRALLSALEYLQSL